MKIELFFNTLKTYFQTIRFLKTNKIEFQDNEETQSLTIKHNQDVLSRINYNYGIGEN